MGIRLQKMRMAKGLYGLFWAWLCMAPGLRAEDDASTSVILILQAENEYRPELSRLEEGMKDVLRTRLKRKIAHVEHAGGRCALRDVCVQRLAAKYAVPDVIWVSLSRKDETKEVQAELYGEDGAIQMRSDRMWTDVFGAGVIPTGVEGMLVQLLAPSRYVGYLRFRNPNAKLTVSVDGIVLSQKECVSALPVSVGPHFVQWRSANGVGQQKRVNVKFQEEAWVDLSTQKGLGGLTWGAAGATALATTVATIFLVDILVSNNQYDEYAQDQLNKLQRPNESLVEQTYDTAWVANNVSAKARGVQASTGIMWTSFAVATLTGTLTAILLAIQNLGDDVE